MSASIRRREFLAGAAGGVALPLFVSSGVLGLGESLPPSDRIGMGYIGLGGRGKQIFGAFGGNDTVALAVCDTWEQRRAAAAERAGPQCKAYKDFREILDRKDIDAVVVATPEHWHVLISLLAVRAGKDVFCEKPLSLTLHEGRILSDACRQHKRLFQHGTQLHGSYPFVPVCEMVRKGRLGKLRAIKVGGRPGGSAPNKEIPIPPELDYEMWSGPAKKLPYVGQANNLGGWNHRSDYSPGYVSAWGIHYIDLVQYGAGKDDTGPVEIEGKGVLATGGFADTLRSWNVDMTYADGLQLSYSNDNAPNRNGVRFEGTEGWVFVSRESSPNLEAEPKSLLEQFGRDKGEPLTSIYENWVNCIRSRKETSCNAEIAHRTTSVCHLANIACITGRRLKWDPQKEQFIGDAEADKLLFREPRAPWKFT
jgi:predicted dehydrogenase